jgi:8-oxo-dGTP pyrophosphatase MutT (NUDIX family)
MGTLQAEDEPGLASVLDLLDAGADLGTRTEFRGHFAAGAILGRPDGRILYIRHLALGRWLMPGGHVEHAGRTVPR